MRLFFIMGAPKSGTTWMQAIMNAHPQVSCFGEGHFVDQIALPMEGLLHHYNRQLALVGALVYGGTPHYAPLHAPDIATLIRATIVGLMSRAGPAPQSLWWGDKTPAYANQIEVLNRLFPACRFINIVRDPRDVAVSVLYHARRSGALADVHNDLPGRQEVIANAVTRWADHVMSVQRAAAGLGERLLQIRYRDLVEQPAPELHRLFGHLPGIAVTGQIVDEVLRTCSFERMSGGRAQGQTDDDSFFRSGTNGGHRTELRPPETDLIERRLGPLMHRLGLA